MNRNTIMAIIVVLPVWMGGCHTHSLKTSPFTLSKANEPNSLVYALPKRVFKITATYTRIAKTEFRNGIPEVELSDVQINKPITIEPLLIADENNILVTSNASVSDDAFLESGIEFTFDSNGILLGVAADIKDRRTEVGRLLFSTAISAAKTVTAVATKNDDLSAGINQLYEQIALLAKAPLPKDDKERDQRAKQLNYLKEELKLLLDIAEMQTASNKIVTTETDREITFIVDPQKHHTTPPGNLLEIDLQADPIFEDVSEMPVLTVSIPITDEHVKYANMHPATDTKGIAYRVPLTLPVSISVDGNKVSHELISFPQYGPIVTASVQSKGLTDRKTSITFCDSTAAMTTYTTESGSSAESLAKTFQASAQELDESIVDMLYGRRLEVLEKKIAIKDAQEKLHPSTIQSLTDQLTELKTMLDAATALSITSQLTTQAEQLTALAEQTKALKDAIAALQEEQ